MVPDIKTILLLRLFSLWNTETTQVYWEQKKITQHLLDKIDSGTAEHFTKDGFVYFYDENEAVYQVVKIVDVEEQSTITGISRQQNLKLYKWNFADRNELVSRGHTPEEKERIKYLAPGFYYISNKIDHAGNILYYISKRLVRGEIVYHKTVGQRKNEPGITYQYLERKNKGKTYSIVGYTNILKEEHARLSVDNLVLSAYHGHSDLIFPKIMSLYVPKKSSVLDLTYGQGVFWRKIPQSDYDLTISDLATTGIDSRILTPHFEAESFDCVVFDPPFFAFPPSKTSLFKRGSVFEQKYKNAKSFKNTVKNSEKPNHEIVLNLYLQTAKEVLNILKPKGVFIVKCQDMVSSGQQRFIHCDIINELNKQGFMPIDLFVLVRKNRPSVNDFQLLQKHARKNHSYFLVFRKRYKQQR